MRITPAIQSFSLSGSPSPQAAQQHEQQRGYQPTDGFGLSGSGGVQNPMMAMNPMMNQLTMELMTQLLSQILSQVIQQLAAEMAMRMQQQMGGQAGQPQGGAVFGPTAQQPQFVVGPTAQPGSQPAQATFGPGPAAQPQFVVGPTAQPASQPAQATFGPGPAAQPATQPQFVVGPSFGPGDSTPVNTGPSYPPAPNTREAQEAAVRVTDAERAADPVGAAAYESFRERSAWRTEEERTAGLAFMRSKQERLGVMYGASGTPV